VDRQQIGWPSAVVAVALLLIIGAVTIAAIAKYPVDEALKVWTALTAIVGVITGAFVSYFFTRGAVQNALDQTRQAHDQANLIRTQGSLNEAALKRIPGHLDPNQWQSMLTSDDVVRRAYEATA
jgi:uncharacterized membrane protein YdjX (TVP38/TMEM64 family)